MPRVLIVGQSGFLSRALARVGVVGSFEVVSWRDVSLDGFDVIVNGAMDPRLKSEVLPSEDDFDLRLAASCEAAGVRYVMLSSRKAYSESVQMGALETSEISGSDVYGQNKATTEARVREVLDPSRLLVVRVANVIGAELEEGRRSFMAMMLRSLRDQGFISFDMSPFVRRDFITDQFFAEAIWKMIERGTTGTVNLGSGQPLMTGNLAMWILEGYGKGEFRVTNPRVFDEFWLDVSRLEEVTGLRADNEDVRKLCIEQGRNLARV